MNKISLQKILSKKMNRKEFLMYMGVFLLSIFGISGLLKSLHDLIPQEKAKTKGFGSGPYGA